MGQFAPIVAQRGSFSPAFTFATPGDLAVTYTGNTLTYDIIDGLLIGRLALILATMTFTTASGLARISLPFPAISPGGDGPISYAKVNLASYPVMQLAIATGDSFATITPSGINQAATSVDATMLATGVPPRFIGTLIYRVY